MQFSIISSISQQWSFFSADRVVPVRVTVPQSVWLLIPEEYESRDIFCCHQPITCKMKCHRKFCNPCQSHFSNLRWPSTVETPSLMVFSRSWFLSVSPKLSRLAAGTSGMIFWVLWSFLSHETWWQHWPEKIYGLFLTFQILALVWLTGERSRLRGCVLDPSECPIWEN